MTTSGGGDEGRFDDDAADTGELGDWLEEAAGADAAAGEDLKTSGGWFGRVFSRDQSGDSSPDDPEGDPPDDPRLSSDPEELSVFSAISIEDDESDEGEDELEVESEFDVDEDDDDDGAGDDIESDEAEEHEWAEAEEEDAFLPEDQFDLEDPVEFDAGKDAELTSDDVTAELEEESDEEQEEELFGFVSGEADEGDDLDLEEAWDDDSVAVDEAEAAATDADVIEIPRTEADTGPSFGELWDGDPGAGDDVIDFASFTSEDYVQATTREYAGLAEAVARAEEEETQRIAVSAEIPGLESGIVGLEDVVGATGGDTADVVEPPSASDLPMRVLTALGLVILFGASLLSPYGIGALIVVVLGIAAGEMYAALIRAGYRPLSIFGFAAIAGAFLGTWAAGPIAIPISLLLGAIAVFLFYATVPGRRTVLENATLTVLVMAWIGGLGGLAFDLLRSDEYQWLVLALVITVAAMDIAQYFVGRRIGKRQLAPQVSPKKTVEGYVAGVVVALAIGAAFSLAEPFEVTDGLIIGAVVAVIAPLGDLAVSVLKRALGVKDMGYILPGHGGVLDRVDAMIMTIPALWLAYSWMGLVT